MSKIGKYSTAGGEVKQSRFTSNGGNGGYMKKAAIPDPVDPRKEPAEMVAGNARGKGRPFRTIRVL
jgi:hypothetical protein